MYDDKQLENELMLLVPDLIKKIKMTQPGSLANLIFGSCPSRQSIVIKMGKFGEEMIKKIIINSSKLELMECGIQCIDDIKGRKKDLDLVWKDEEKKIIYYRELKANIELDTEKLPATINKIIEIRDFLILKFPEYTIDFGLLNWSIYNRYILKKGLAQIKKLECNGIKVEHMYDILKLLNFIWLEDDFHKFFRMIGDRIDDMFKI